MTMPNYQQPNPESILRNKTTGKSQNHVTRFAVDPSKIKINNNTTTAYNNTYNNNNNIALSSHSKQKQQPRRTSNKSSSDNPSPNVIRRGSKGTDASHTWSRSRLRSSQKEDDENNNSGGGGGIAESAAIVARITEGNYPKTHKDKILDHYFGDDVPEKKKQQPQQQQQQAKHQSNGSGNQGVVVRRPSTGDAPGGSSAAASTARRHTHPVKRTRRSPRAPPKTDRFGFVLSEESSESEDEKVGGGGATKNVRVQQQKSQPDPAKRISGLRNKRTATVANKRTVGDVREKREKKWIKMLRTWDRTTKEKKKKAKLVKRVRKGIPDKVRGAAWSLLGEVPNTIEVHNRGVYNKLLRVADQIGKGGERENHELVQVRDTIERDIKRTFPKHVMFKDESEEENDDEDQANARNNGVLAGVRKVFDNKKKNVQVVVNTREDETPDLLRSTGGQAALRRVLRAYSMYDKETGYCQGMNFIAAMFITFMSEEEAFWLLVFVMNDQPCKIRKLFGRDMSQSTQTLHVASCLINQFFPKLAQHLDRENIHISMFATQWLITIYTSSFPFELVTRVWDCFLAEGWKIVYRVMLAILSVNELDLMKADFEAIMGIFRDVPNTVNADNIFEVAFKIPLKRKHVEKYEKEYLQSLS